MVVNRPLKMKGTPAHSYVNMLSAITLGVCTLFGAAAVYIPRERMRPRFRKMEEFFQGIAEESRFINPEGYSAWAGSDMGRMVVRSSAELKKQREDIEDFSMFVTDSKL
ncbi:unnamed protein product [Notodromas monacha]|uniref:Uncharacterized protein n=1 Tax=Notodromas monacha TaxID=399045 RepID=A0A7R9GDJ6_9CRUS|nr:unnamed protein product [Notodromas monacha]CAG0918743.1 unnamed protein product [Notodromas monacha]